MFKLNLRPYSIIFLEKLFLVCVVSSWLTPKGCYLARVLPLEIIKIFVIMAITYKLLSDSLSFPLYHQIFCTFSSLTKWEASLSRLQKFRKKIFIREIKLYQHLHKEAFLKLMNKGDICSSIHEIVLEIFMSIWTLTWVDHK